nr:hypothetical protein [Tanacetum cinerariifolium]
KAKSSIEEDELSQPWAPSVSEKPNGSSYRTPHWLKWRNYMANGTNTTASKNRGCRVFHLYMDEFCDSKITISVQRDHRKARSEEDSSSPVNSSRNAKIPGPNRNTHSPEHQDNPTRMHNGLRTGSTASRYHSGSRGKNQKKSLPFFKTLKKCTEKSDYQWTAEAKAAFKEMKKLIAELPTLTAPVEREELIVYLAAAREAAHTIIVITDQPIKQILSRPKVAGRLQKWSTELVKRPKEDPLDTPMEDEEELTDSWTLFTNGSSCVDGFEARLILTNTEGAEFTYALRFSQGAWHDIVFRESEKLKKNSIKQVLVEELKEKSINEAEVLAVVKEEGDTWMNLIYFYITKEPLPAEKEKARVIRRKSGSKGYTDKILLATNARKLIRARQDCQVHCLVPRNPQQKLTPTMSLWPFYNYGIDIAGPFSEGPGKVKFLIVAMDYFTKWIETKPVATITGQWLSRKRNRSLGEGIKARLDERSKDYIEEIPHVLWAHRTMIKSSNEDTSFSLTYGKEAVIPAEIGMPSMRIAEVDMFRRGNKGTMDERSKDRIEELPHVLWAHRTMTKSSNGDAPFSLTYGTEAVILAEIGMPIMRTMEVDMVQNNEALKINLDLLEEIREQAAIREAKSKAKMEKYYNFKVRNTSFKP